MAEIKESPQQAVQRLSQYIDVQNKEFQLKLGQATTSGDRRDILVAYTKPQHNLMTLFSSTSPWVQEVIDEMAEKFAERPEGVQVTLAEPAPQKPIVRRTVVVKSKKTGAELYRKAVARMFTYREETFLKMAVKRGLKPKGVLESYNERFDARSRSSISTKMSRLRKR